MCEFFNRDLPEPLKGKESGTWAHETITRRLPEIADRVKKENDFPTGIEDRIDHLIHEIPDSDIRMIEDHQALDYEEWESYISPYIGQNWLEVPWFFAEFYFYRRILEAVGYFSGRKSSQVDPYRYQKEQGITASQKAIAQLCENLAAWRKHDFDRYELLEELITIDLWGNQADLSLWPAQEGGDEPSTSAQDQAERILVNDLENAISHLRHSAPAQRIDFILDNAGFEMVCDLLLTAFLLGENLAKRVILHVKPYPIFVSDAMEKDVLYTIERLSKMGDENVSSLGHNLDRYLGNGRMDLRSSYFWGSPLAMWDMPSGMKQEFSQSRLVLLKGDANYRRILGDRCWNFSTPFTEIACYFPTSLLALRVCKSEVASGLTQAIVDQTRARDQDWLVDGNWGMIQYSKTPQA